MQMIQKPKKNYFKKDQNVTDKCYPKRISNDIGFVTETYDLGYDKMFCFVLLSPKL